LKDFVSAAFAFSCGAGKRPIREGNLSSQAGKLDPSQGMRSKIKLFCLQYREERIAGAKRNSRRSLSTPGTGARKEEGVSEKSYKCASAQRRASEIILQKE